VEKRGGERKVTRTKIRPSIHSIEGGGKCEGNTLEVIMSRGAWGWVVEKGDGRGRGNEIKQKM